MQSPWGSMMNVPRFPPGRMVRSGHLDRSGRPRKADRIPRAVSALELLADRLENHLRRLADEVRVSGGQRGCPVQPGTLGRLLLQREHVLQDLLVSLEPGQAVLLGLLGDLVAELLHSLGGGL